MSDIIQPLVSIIIPTYNRAHLIRETLDSILAQSYTNWECIVVDDGSVDNTSEILTNYCKNDNRFQYYQRPDSEMKGANSCRNYGFKLSKGEFINWFDSDDLYKENYIDKLVKKNTEDIDVIVCEIQKFSNNSKTKLNRIYSENLIEDYLTGKVVFYISGPLWKKSFLDKQEFLLDETISNLDDWDFNLRMLYQKPNIKYVKIPLIYYRVHENSLSHEIGKLNFIEVLSEFKAREKHVKLLKVNKKANPKILKEFIKKRYNFFFRLAMVENNNKKIFFLKKVLIKQLNSFDIIGVLKTIFGFIVFSIFKKGYKFLE
ncbi:hypothetical protein CW731_03510 [Polaribacter sp. ALD11]|uniref:glycosyltransferase family 2 protein n=1 Tax=Polaribacter sp. ALD11 TaxID=2058137 RepID=UPI000C30B7AB|nr:glycosyltransferase [Polaribacter sp. ALD11]AUC84422.1 hypothetical protein CW731_03510 [Polaribacter sp. ALD11]